MFREHWPTGRPFILLLWLGPCLNLHLHLKIGTVTGKMDLFSICLLMASDRRPAGRKVAPLPRTSWTFLNEIQFRVQRWWVHPKVQRREQTDWPFVDLQMSLKFPPNALLQLSAYHNENIRSLMPICGFHHPEGLEATSLRSPRMFFYGRLLRTLVVAAGDQMREPSTTCGSCKMTRPGQLSPEIYGKFMIGQHYHRCTK